MRTRRQATLEDLRRAVDSLPRHTRVAMLEGIAGNEIIAGAYATADGICPMLAAHRAGGRTSLISFARAWDRFAFRDARSQRARRATERELLILRSHLEASLLAEERPEAGLAAARAEHLELLARRGGEAPAAADEGPGSGGARQPRRRPPTRRRSDPERPRPGDRDRSAELGSRPGWAWTAVVRRYDDYERVIRRVEAERRGASAEPPAAEPPVALPAARR